MDKEELRKYLAVRRMGWPYEGSYRIERKGGHRFIAMVGDELAGLSYMETPGGAPEHGAAGKREARMRMTLKAKFAEFGIGTELLELLMEDLQAAGFDVIRYEIPLERYALQIYRNLGFRVESQDEETVRFIWERICDSIDL